MWNDAVPDARFDVSRCTQVPPGGSCEAETWGVEGAEGVEVTIGFPVGIQILGRLKRFTMIYICISLRSCRRVVCLDLGNWPIVNTEKLHCSI